MPASINPETFTIRPSASLLGRHPELRRLSNALALRFAHKEVVPNGMLRATGEALWQSLGVQTEFDEMHRRAGSRMTPIVVESDRAAILRLPWETLCHPQHGFLGLESGFTLSRRITGAAVDQGEFETGPLRILLFTAIPEDEARLSVEEHQAQLREILLPLIAKGLVTLEMPNDGRFERFKQALKEQQPHVVFFNVHGRYHDRSLENAPPFASFLFESVTDNSQPITDSELAGAFIGTSVQCVVLASCESGMSDSNQLNTGLLHRLALQGVPHVIGMRESIGDLAGRQFILSFCDAVARRERVDAALQAARRAMTGLPQDEKRASDSAVQNEYKWGQWCVPALISHNPARALIDWHFTPQAAEAPMDCQSLSSMSLPRRFIGRRSELRVLEQALCDRRRHKLLITGPGGQGKTALAGQLALTLRQQGCRVIAWNVREKRTWGEFQLDLAVSPGKDPAERDGRMAAGYETNPDSIQAGLTRILGQANHPIVLLFDNLDSVQDPSTREITDPITRAWVETAAALSGPKLTLLLTSRWLLPGWPETDHWPLEHLGYDDFLQLARFQKLPVESLSKRDWLRPLYSTLHGNARGLEFFARAGQATSEDEEQRFRQKLATASETLQADMALATLFSHRSPQQQELLKRLSVFQSPVPIEGVIKLAPDLEKPEDLLSELEAVSLVERSCNHPCSCVEYQIPATVAEWIAKMHPIRPSHPCFKAAAEYQLGLFRGERPTLKQAVRAHYALYLAGERERADKLALDEIVGTLSQQGLYRSVLRDWLPSIRESENPHIRGGALNQTGKQYLHLGDYDKALPYLEHSLAIRRDIGDKAGEAVTLSNISGILQSRGDLDTALDCLNHALAIKQEIGDRAGEAITLNNISQIFQTRGDFDTALDCLKRSLAINREVDDKSAEGIALINISRIFRARGDFDTALDCVKRSLAIEREAGDKAAEGAALNSISQIFQARGDFDTALAYMKQSLDIRQIIGDKAGECETINNIATVFQDRGDLDTAFDYFEQAIAIQREIGDKAGEGVTLNNISQIFEVRGDLDAALDCLKHAVAMHREAGNKPGLCLTLLNLGHIHLQNEDVQEAVATWIDVYSMAKSIRLAQALRGLERAAEQLGYSGGLAAWEKLAQQARHRGGTRLFS